MADARNDEQVQRRRRAPRVPVRAIAFLGVLAAGVLIGWVLFGDDDSSQGPQPASTATAPATGETRVDVDARLYPRFGLALGLPEGWRATVRRGVLTTASRDATISVAFSVAGGGGQGPRVRRAERQELARLFDAREVSRRRAKVGAAPTIVTELSGRARRSGRIRILSMAASSRWRTYSVQVFTVPAPGARRLLELRALLTSVGYSEPG
ncbi:MAG TPA: hypothetical protein VMY78_12730 [Solirubrobacteraceae bacterium]|nr:hypothetical protein [Solirubrobacteraceae bacterium]